MDRRTFLGTLTGGLLAAPFAAEAQEGGRLYRIGVLRKGPDPLSTSFVDSAWGADAAAAHARRRVLYNDAT